MMDTVIHGGKVHTVDPLFQTAEAIAIKDGCVAATGDTARIRALATWRTNEIDIGGATVIPGLIDSHVHLAEEANAWGMVDLRRSSSIAEVLARLKRHAAGVSAGQWVSSSPFWHEANTSEGRLPTRQELDDACPDHPVFVPRGMYRCSVNSHALRLAGIGPDSRQPENGFIGRDEHGEPTGFLMRAAQRPILALQPVPSWDNRVDALERAMTSCSRLGITGIREAATKPGDARMLMKLRAEDRLPLRVSMVMLSGQPLSGKPLADAQPVVQHVTGLPLRAGFGDDWLRVTGVKMLMDGGVEGSHLSGGYANDPDYRGFARVTGDILDEALDVIAAAGWPLAMHVSGDAAMKEFLAAAERVARNYDIGRLRWTIEHAFFTTREECERIRELGLLVTVQPALMYDFGDAMELNWGRDRVQAMSCVRDMVEAGIRPGGGSDGPFVSLSPLLGMQVLMTRETARAGVFGAAQSVDARTALAMYTRYNAHLTFEEHVRGSLEPGKLADLVVLDGDPLAVQPDEVGRIRVLMTMVGGRIVYRDGV